MAATALPNFINNVITALQNSSALTGVQIYDGPTVSIDSYPSNWIAIGHDGNEDGDVSVGTFRNNWELVGNYKRWEEGELNCTLVAQSGDNTNLPAIRTTAYSMLSAVDTIMRSDPSVGGSVLYSGLESHEPRYMQTNAGAACIIIFTIAYRART